MKKYLFILLSLGLSLSVPCLVIAADTPGIEKANQLITTATTYIRVIGYSAAVAALIYAGILYFTAYGNEEKPRQAKNVFMGVLIGLLFIILAQTVVTSIIGQVSSPENKTGSLPANTT